MHNRPYITLFSTPLVSTWVFDETRRILFDAGDGAAAMLDQRLAKVQMVALTHSHRDHIGGLLQLLNLRGGMGELNVLYPRGNGAIRAYTQFLSGFDRYTTGTANIVEFEDGQEWALPDERLILRSFRNEHIDDNTTEQIKSIGYQMIRRVDKLRPEYEGFSQQELDKIRVDKGKEALVAPQDKLIFAYTGDTAPMDPSVYKGCDYLLHECTFLDEEDGEEYNARAHGHSVLGEVLTLAKEAKVHQLGLFHISRRYDNTTIRQRVLEMCRKLNVPFRVSIAYPGECIYDLFGNPTWNGGGD
ncbi:MAG: MBL fold metallo-hydrolase [bacterium]|jgi:ribonuclease Z